MWRGRRWYSAHREHLYQWLVRAGFTHARVVALYLAWNVLIALPVVCWMNRSLPSLAESGAVAPTGFAPAIALYGVAVAVWIAGKRWCMQRVRSRCRAC
jgi:hypothetical protein